MILAQAAQSTVPWWALPTIAGVFALAGVAISQTAGYLLERGRRAREDRRRFDKELRESCVRFIAATHAIVEELKIAPAPPGGRRSIVTSLRPVTDSVWELQLMAPDPVVTAADKVVSELAALATSEGPISTFRVFAAVSQFSVAVANTFGIERTAQDFSEPAYINPHFVRINQQSNDGS